MTMHKWRSLFGTGCLMAVLVLFGSATGFATPPTSTTSAVTVTTPSVDGFNTLSVAWESNHAATDAEPTTMFEIGYKQQTGAAFVGGVALDGTMSVRVGTSPYRASITGLKAGKSYLVAVRAKSADATDNAGDWVYGTVTMTASAPMPGNVDHRDIVITEYNTALGVEWREPLAGHDDLMIEKYMVEFSTKKTSGWKAWPTDPTEPMVMITGLTNGTMYYVRIKAVNDAGGMSAAWSTVVDGTPMMDGGTATTPTPTPALPVFGALALGAGVLAAGRARLRRRREQRQLMAR